MPDPLAARRPRWSVRRQVVVFLLLTVVLSWWAWPLTLLNPTSTALVPIGPSIAAVVVTALSGGRRAVAALLRQLVRWRVHPGWYAAALLGPPVLIGAVVLANRALGAAVEPSATFPGWHLLPLLFAIRIVVGGPLGEELGWRGFLLPLLMQRHGALVASLLVAPLWFAFHLPAMLSGPATAQRPVLSFLLWVVMASVLHTWLWLRTEHSVLVVMLFHGAIDTSAALLLPQFTGADYTRAWWLLVAFTTAAAALVVLRDHRFRRLRDVDHAGAGSRTSLAGATG